MVLDLKIIQADDTSKEKLNLESKDNIWEIKRVRIADNKKVSYMPVRLFPNLSIDNCNGSLYKYVEDICGYKIAMSEREVKAIIYNEETEEVLEAFNLLVIYTYNIYHSL